MMAIRTALLATASFGGAHYDVPAQKASAEVPFSECAISGSTVTRTVASRATMSEMKLKLIMTSNSFLECFHSVGSAASALASRSRSIVEVNDR
jgi:hypothetical protein